MLKLWSGDRVFGREARPPEWPYTNSSDRRGSRRKPRQWCRLFVQSFYLHHWRRNVPATIRAFQRTLTDIAHLLRRKSPGELMRNRISRFVTHLSQWLIFAQPGLAFHLSFSRVGIDHVFDHLISTHKPKHETRVSAIQFLKLVLGTKKLTVKRFDIVVAVPVVEFCWVTDYVLDGSVIRWPSLLRNDRHDIGEKHLIFPVCPYCRCAGFPLYSKTRHFKVRTDHKHQTQPINFALRPWPTKEFG
jgi:hypothetical protein